MGGGEGTGPGITEQEVALLRANAQRQLPPKTNLAFSDPARWRFERIISHAGRSAEVARGTDSNDGSPVAIKYLRDVVGAEAVHLASQRFEQEARIPNLVRHPNVIPTLAAFERPHPYDANAKQYVIVQPFIEHLTLEQILTRGDGKTLDGKRFLSEMSGVLLAMQEANVLHRDLHPGNIFVTPDERYLVTDFGKARHADSVLGSVHGTNVPGEAQRLNYIDWTNLRGLIDARSDLISTARLATAILRGEHYTRAIGASEFPSMPALRDFLRVHADEINDTMSKDAQTFARELERSLGSNTARLTRIEPLSTSSTNHIQSPTSSLVTDDDDYTGEHPLPTKPTPFDANKLPERLRNNLEILAPYRMTGRRFEDEVREMYGNKMAFLSDAMKYRANIQAIRQIIPSVHAILVPYEEPIDTLLEEKNKYKRILFQEAQKIDRILVAAGVTSHDPEVLRKNGVTYETQWQQHQARKPGLFANKGTKEEWNRDRELLFHSIGHESQARKIRFEGITATATGMGTAVAALYQQPELIGIFSALTAMSIMAGTQDFLEERKKIKYLIKEADKRFEEDGLTRRLRGHHTM